MTPETPEVATALAACPFCGFAAIALEQYNAEYDTWRVVCDDCDASSPVRSKADAIAAWNRRSPVVASALNQPEPVRDGEWVDGVVVHANGGVGFQSVAWRQEHFYDGQRAVLAMVLHKSACHPVHRGHHCDYRAALQSIHEMVRAQLKVRPPARGASQNGADVGLDELANKAAWCLEHGATNENADLARSVIAYRRALTSRSPVEK